MSKEMITGRQVGEAVGWLTRLPLEEYNQRRTWLERLTDPGFDLKLLAGVLIPTTYGPAISPPFNGAELIADGPGDAELVAGIARIKLLPILTVGDRESIRFEEACRRGSANPATNWGQRAAFALRDAGNAGKISKEVWPVGQYVVCPRTHWRDPQYGFVCVWDVYRDEGGFFCRYRWFGNSVDRDGRFVSLGPPAAQPSGEASK